MINKTTKEIHLARIRRESEKRALKYFPKKGKQYESAIEQDRYVAEHNWKCNHPKGYLDTEWELRKVINKARAKALNLFTKDEVLDAWKHGICYRDFKQDFFNKLPPDMKDRWGTLPDYWVHKWISEVSNYEGVCTLENGYIDRNENRRLFSITKPKKIKAEVHMVAFSNGLASDAHGIYFENPHRGSSSGMGLTHASHSPKHIIYYWYEKLVKHITEPDFLGPRVQKGLLAELDAQKKQAIQNLHPWGTTFWR